MMPVHHAWAFAQNGPMPNGEEEVVLLLGQWPDTTGINPTWIHKMQALHPQIPSEFRNLSLEEAIGKLVSMLQKCAVKSVFRPMSTTRIARWAFDAHNTEQSKHLCIRTKHIPSNFIGSTLPRYVSRGVFLSPKEVADLISLSTTVMRRKLGHL